jgi:hypothetical protein
MTDQRDVSQQRSRAVKTAWLLALIAGSIFVAFILSGVFGEAS